MKALHILRSAVHKSWLQMFPEVCDRGVEDAGWGYSSSDSGRLRTQPWATLLKLGLRRRSSKPLMSSGTKGVPALGMVSPTRAPPKGTGVLGEEEQQEGWELWDRNGSTLTCGSPCGAPPLPLPGPQFPLLYNKVSYYL